MGPSFRPDVFLEVDYSSFLNFVGKKKNCPKNGESGRNIGFFEFIEKFRYYLFLNLIYNESLYYLLYLCINLIFGKNLVPVIWTKMLLANQIVGFLNQIYILK